MIPYFPQPGYHLFGPVTVHAFGAIVATAEIAAGSIAMGLGGYLAARTDREHYASERNREYREIREIPAATLFPLPSSPSRPPGSFCQLVLSV